MRFWIQHFVHDKNFIARLCLYSTMVSCCGCFEVVEEVSYISEDSGNYQFIINCSQSKEKLKSYLRLDSFLGMNIPNRNEIEDYMARTTEILKSTAGINHVVNKNDFEECIFRISFSFDSTAALNQGIILCSNQMAGSQKTILSKQYQINANEFVRFQTPGDSLLKISSKREDIFKLFSEASITSIYRFIKPVISVSNPEARISKHRKAVMMKQNLLDVFSNPIIHSTHILFK